MQKSSVELKQQFSEVFSSEQTQAEKNAYDYYVNEESKLQIKNYEKKNWNVIHCYNN